jgi:hypothetical protein
VDYVGRFEAMDQSLAHVARETGLAMKMPHINVSPSRGKSYQELYSQQSVEIIRERYAADLEHFGYSF